MIFRIEAMQFRSAVVSYTGVEVVIRCHGFHSILFGISVVLCAAAVGVAVNFDAAVSFAFVRGVS